MAEDLIWCSAQLPHQYEVGVRVRMWWHPPPQRSYKGLPAKAPGVAVKDGDRPQMRTNRHRGFLHASRTHRPQISVSRRHRMCSFLLAFNRPPPPSLMGRSLVSVGSTAHCGSSLMRLSRLTVTTMGIGVTHGALVNHVLHTGAPLSFLIFSQVLSLRPSSSIVRPASLPAPP